MTLISVDPAVTDEAHGSRLDPSLDMFNPTNGFGPGGAHYPGAFRKRFFAAEASRNNALIARAQAQERAIDGGQGRFRDDDVFVAPGGYIGNNRLLTADVSLMAHSRAAWPLLHGDGSVTTGIVPTVRVPEGGRSPSPNYRGGAIKTTVKGFLSTYAVRADPDFGYDATGIRGVQWRSSYATVPGNVEAIAAPTLVLGMTGHWEGWAAETIYDHARSVDKMLAFVEGATHGLEPCRPCERTPGAFGDTEKTAYDFVDQWLSKPGRFR